MASTTEAASKPPSTTSTTSKPLSTASGRDSTLTNLCAVPHCSSLFTLAAPFYSTRTPFDHLPSPNLCPDCNRGYLRNLDQVSAKLEHRAKASGTASIKSVLAKASPPAFAQPALGLPGLSSPGDVGTENDRQECLCVLGLSEIERAGDEKVGKSLDGATGSRGAGSRERAARRRRRWAEEREKSARGMNGGRGVITAVGMEEGGGCCVIM